jgi:hypothetical protein
LQLYFAYGSNMSSARMTVEDRAPDARVVAVGNLSGYALRFHKRGRDGSGKCDAFETGNAADRVWGVVYEITARDERRLDRVEGLGVGYDKRQVDVVVGSEAWLCVTYVARASHIEPSLQPLAWYLDWVIDGALENELPVTYVDSLRSRVLPLET